MSPAGPGIDGADDLYVPELLARVKDFHYAEAHGGEHRSDASRGAKSSGSNGKKAEGKKAEGKKKAAGKKSENKDGGRKAQRAVADLRRRLAKLEESVDELEAALS
ncbi:hypothetical protein [Pseudonocardia broussonetiae]|uniref:Uncharacterized protein n=1 Tax=Pseudonocardia broussonetiae TaxID=2736640 RepID=A0A6M6JI68_9PSEU|nr:hypothetical protein [Pseudonocardia broussonetiae]QJY47718.1 hypothetical protein HOP40_19475 [Pseudonocardia broussonetiae]